MDEGNYERIFDEMAGGVQRRFLARSNNIEFDIKAEYKKVFAQGLKSKNRSLKNVLNSTLP